MRLDEVFNQEGFIGSSVLEEKMGASKAYRLNTADMQKGVSVYS